MNQLVALPTPKQEEWRYADFGALEALAPEAAKKLLVRAFIGDAFVALDDEAEQDKMLEAALAALGDAV